MTIAELARVIQRRLRDDTGRQWSTEYVLEAIDAAFGALCTVLPQAYTEHRTLQLSRGSEQQIDDDLHRILHLLHNVCDDGSAGRSVIKADLSLMDRAAPNWRQDNPRGYIIHYLLNPLDETKFYVWPPVPALQGDLEAPVAPEVVADPGPIGNGANVADIPLAAQTFGVTSGGDQTRIVIADTAFRDAFIAETGGTSLSATGLTLDLVLPDASHEGYGTSSVIFLGGDVYNDGDTASSFAFASIFDSLVGGAALTWDSPGIEPGAVLRVQFVTTQARLEGIDLFDEGTTQADIDAYQLYLIEQATYLEALDVFNATPADVLVRGVFTKTPCILQGDPPEDPGPEPVAPVDPGPINTGLPDGINVAEPAITFVVNVNTSASGVNQFNPLRFIDAGNSSMQDKVLLLDMQSVADFMSATADTASPYAQSSVVSGNFNAHGAFEDVSRLPANRGPGVSSDPLRLGDMRFMIDNGTPFLPITASGGTFRQIGPPVVDAEGLTDPLQFITTLAAVTDLSNDAGFVSLDEETVTLQGTNQTVLSADGTGAATPSAGEIALADALLALDRGDFIDLDVNGISTNQTIVLRNNDGALVYNFPPSELIQGSSIPPTSATTARANRSTYLIARQAVPDGQQGEIVNADVFTPAPDGAPSYAFMQPGPALTADYEQRVTQEVRDAYLEALLAFPDELATYEAQLQLFTDFSLGRILTADSLVPFDKAHLQPLSEYAMYYSLMRDSEQTPNSGRAMQHWQNFFQLLNARERSEVAVKLAEDDSE